MNDELSVGIQSRDIAATLTSLFEQDLQRSRHLTLEVWRQRSVLTKGNERFWTLFGELF
jgi:cardiolipin synthase